MALSRCTDAAVFPGPFTGAPLNINKGGKFVFTKPGSCRAVVMPETGRCDATSFWRSTAWRRGSSAEREDGREHRLPPPSPPEDAEAPEGGVPRRPALFTLGARAARWPRRLWGNRGPSCGRGDLFLDHSRECVVRLLTCLMLS